MKKSFLLFLVLLSLPLVSAFNSYYWYSPSQLLDNEWVVFGLIFIAIFAMTFFALGRTMAENKGASAVISAVIALFIAVAVSRRNLFYGYVGESIGSWLFIVAILLGAIILIKLIVGFIGGIGFFLALFALWFLFRSVDPYDIFPYEFLSSDIFPVYEFLSGTGFLIMVIIVFGLILILAYAGGGNEQIKNWLWRSREKKPYWPWTK